MKRLLICLLTILLLITSCGEGTETTSNVSTSSVSETDNITFALPYYSGELLNPYTVESKTNCDILTLIYSSLIVVTNDFTAKEVLAEKYTFEENVLVFTLRADIKFSDNTPLKASDIVYSYNKAKGNTARYGLRFSKIKNFYARDDLTFCAEVAVAAERTVNLFNIPIIKANSDLNGKPPIGCGRYMLKNSTDISLTPSPGYPDSNAFTIQEIPLVDMPDEDTLLHSLNSGIVTAAYTDMSEKSAGLKGDLELREVKQNNVVFAGLNTRRAHFRSADTRRAFSMIIDRNKIAEDIMLGHAEDVWQPFNPSWQTLKDALLPQDIYNPDAAMEILKKSGITAELKIIVNLDNRMRVDVAKELANNLKSAGINAVVTELKWDAYLTSLKKSDFDIYIGEVILPADMDISVLYSNNVNYTGSNGSSVISALNMFDTAGADIGTVSEAFDADSSILPLYYRMAALAVSKRVQGNINPLPYYIYNGLENWVLE